MPLKDAWAILIVIAAVIYTFGLITGVAMTIVIG